MRAHVLAAAFALIGAGCGKTSVVPPGIHWHSLANGEATARALGKPAFVFFFAEWSTADKELDEVTFVAPNVRAEMQGFVPIRVDVSDDELPGVNQVKDRFRVLGVPTMLVVNSFEERAESFRANEFMPPQDLAPKLRQARHDYERFRAERLRSE